MDVDASFRGTLLTPDHQNILGVSCAADVKSNGNFSPVIIISVYQIQNDNVLAIILAI